MCTDLKHGCCERGREEEAADPEDGGLTLLCEIPSEAKFKEVCMAFKDVVG